MSSPASTIRRHQPLLDSLRGWAAFSVLCYHTFGLDYFSALPGVQWLAALQAHRAAVLLFFVLSGYVIGFTNQGPWAPEAVKSYAGRRFWRIAPIYLVALLLGAAATPHFSLREFLGNAAFLQNFDLDSPFGIQPIGGNQPLWSLHYEIIYYVLFILWWRWPATIPVFLAGGILVSFGATAWPGSLAFWSSHGTGIVFWLAGLLIARSPVLAGPAPAGRIWSHIGWLHAAQHAATLSVVLSGLHLLRPGQNLLPFGDFVLLPGCVTLVALAGQRRLPWAGAWSALAFLVCAAGCVVVLVCHKPLDDPRWVAVLAFTAAGVLVWRLPLRAGLQCAARVGSFSYGLYAVHFPILLFASAWCAGPTSRPGAFAGAALSWTGAFSLAWLLELRLRPWLRSQLSVLLSLP